jgi:hypothetical protein
MLGFVDALMGTQKNILIPDVRYEEIIFHQFEWSAEYE